MYNCNQPKPDLEGVAAQVQRGLADAASERGHVRELCSIDLEELDLKLERGIGRYYRRETPSTVRLELTYSVCGMRRDGRGGFLKKAGSDAKTHVVWCCSEDSLLTQGQLWHT